MYNDYGTPGAIAGSDEDYTYYYDATGRLMRRKKDTGETEDATVPNYGTGRGRLSNEISQFAATYKIGQSLGGALQSKFGNNGQGQRVQGSVDKDKATFGDAGSDAAFKVAHDGYTPSSVLSGNPGKANENFTPENAQAVKDTASRLGISSHDLATVIGYETGGSYSPSQWGGAGGKYLGLIQFGPTEQKQYGVTPNQSFPDQMKSVESYLRDRGVKPGMGLTDLYSTVLAGSPGHPDARDSGGSVSDHVAKMTNSQTARADLFLGTSPQNAPVTGASNQPDGTWKYNNNVPPTPASWAGTRQQYEQYYLSQNQQPQTAPDAIAQAAPMQPQQPPTQVSAYAGQPYTSATPGGPQSATGYGIPPQAGQPSPQTPQGIPAPKTPDQIQDADQDADDAQDEQAFSRGGYVSRDHVIRDRNIARSVAKAAALMKCFHIHRLTMINRQPGYYSGGTVMPTPGPSRPDRTAIPVPGVRIGVDRGTNPGGGFTAKTAIKQPGYDMGGVVSPYQEAYNATTGTQQPPQYRYQPQGGLGVNALAAFNATQGNNNNNNEQLSPLAQSMGLQPVADQMQDAQQDMQDNISSGIQGMADQAQDAVQDSGLAFKSGGKVAQLRLDAQQTLPTIQGGGPQPPRAIPPGPFAPTRGFADGGSVDDDSDDDTTSSTPSGTPASAPANGYAQAGDPISDLISNVGQAIDGGLKFLQHSLGLGGTGPDGSPAQQSAMPASPGQQTGAAQLKAGGGAPQLTPDDADTIGQTVDPDGQLQEGLRNTAGLSAVYQFKLAHGDISGAQRIAASLIQYSSGLAAQYGQQALNLLKQGNLAAAVGAVAKAYDQVPDGKTADATVYPQNGTADVVQRDANGNVIQRQLVDAKTIIGLANGFATKDLYYRTLMCIS